jgi:hypothetical protein
LQASASPGNVIARLYTSPAPWSKPAALKAVKVTVISAGGGGGTSSGSLLPAPAGTHVNGGSGGSGAQYIYFAQSPAIPGAQTVTVGSGGAASSAGGASSFGTLVTVPGGSAGGNAPANTPGASGGTPGISSSPLTVTLQGSIVGGYGYGSGGSGGPGTPNSPVPGSPGTPGFVLIEEYY